MANLEQVHVAVTEEIKILQQQIMDNEVKIQELQNQNEKAATRVKGLLSAKEKMDEAVQELASLPVWEGAAKPTNTRTPVKAIITILLKDVLVGLTIKEIMAQSVREHNVELKEGSLRSVLSHEISSGNIERTIDRKYRLKRLAEKAA